MSSSCVCDRDQLIFICVSFMCFRQRSVDIYLCFVRVFSTEILLEQLLHRLPSLETAEVKQFVNGPESFTPDGRYILGHAPEVFIIIVVVISSSSSYHNNHHHNLIIIIIIPSSVPTPITSLKCINLPPFYDESCP